MCNNENFLTVFFPQVTFAEGLKKSFPSSVSEVKKSKSHSERSGKTKVINSISLSSMHTSNTFIFTGCR